MSPMTMRSISRLVLTLAAVLACLWTAWSTLKLAYGQILVKYAGTTRNMLAANEGLRFARKDAEAHFTRAVLLRSAGALNESLGELETAVSLRPRDYYLWYELGLTRDEMSKPDEALEALNRAVELAPFYGQPRWQRGNLLLRLKKYEEAFSDLRAAAESDPDLVPNLIDLSWGFSQANPEVAQQLAQINNPKMRIAFAQYLARRHRPVEAYEQFMLAGGGITDESRRELIAQLISAGAFTEAYRLFSGRELSGMPEIQDGGFEARLSLDEAGFGWRVSRVANTSLSLTTAEPQSGSKSLQIDFSGESPSGATILSQILVVQPSTTYQLSFACRTKDIVSGGLPVMSVSDVAPAKQVLGASAALPQGTTNWQIITFSFTTAADTKAVVLSLQRSSCATAPCPAFGTLWLDSFGIEINQKNVNKPTSS